MKSSSELRAIARESLKGKWAIAILAGVLASVLGAISSGSGGNVNINLEGLGPDVNVNISNISFDNIMNAEWVPLVLGFISVVFIVALIIGIALALLGSIIEVGYAKFNMNLVDNEEAEINNLFAYFRNWKNAICTRLLKSIYEFLWTLLFIIPGIMAAYSYAMTPYILADNPELTAGEAIAKSKEMMYGHRWELFCLELSFIGWAFLCVFTFGIGNLWLTPYTQTSRAAFYREISGTWPVAVIPEGISEGPVIE